MIEADLLVIIYLLFYGMIASTIVNVALIIATARLLIKQQQKHYILLWRAM